MIEKVSDVFDEIKDFLNKQKDIVKSVCMDFETAPQSPFIVFELPTRDNLRPLNLYENALEHNLKLAYHVALETPDLYESMCIASDLAMVLRNRFITKYNISDQQDSKIKSISFDDVEYLQIKEPLLVSVRQHFTITFEELVVESGPIIEKIINRLNDYKKTRIIITDEIK